MSRCASRAGSDRYALRPAAAPLPVALATLAALTALAVLVMLATLATLLGAAPAAAASFRYWGYYEGVDGGWEFRTTGPGEAIPEDGGVEGWRFAVSAEAGPPRVPRAAGDFPAICDGAEPAEGTKRVAVVIDPGLVEEAPEGERPPPPRGACAVVPADATGADVIAEVATVRAQGGLVCAIDGYPAAECGDEVDAPVPATSDAPVALERPDTDPAAGPAAGDPEAATDESGGVGLAGPVGIAVVVLVVAALALMAVLRSRRGRAG